MNKWHKIQLDCPKCKGQFTILSLSCCADGEIMADGCCAHCGIPLFWKSTGARLIASAVLADIEEESAKKIPLKPLMKFNDNSFLREMGIQGDTDAPPQA